ncbi:hypothetical protein ACIPY3_02515 [Paenarthrobacter sp. NPDC089714]|uniref:hypothetical protein n=1 Tax=Paenarthrobacter sp. NPDC089714 TaxID=3364377 RepID=UPI0037F5CECD
MMTKADEIRQKIRKLAQEIEATLERLAEQMRAGEFLEAAATLADLRPLLKRKDGMVLELLEVYREAGK